MHLPGLLSLTFASILAAPGSSPNPAKDRPPNLILVLIDDMGAKELGCYGNKEYKTPNMDRLAREGMRFETCYATPYCTPTRVAIMTGQYGFRTGYFHMAGMGYTPFPSSPEFEIGSKFTFADLLKTRGYRTALAGKWQLTGKVPSLIHDCGFDEYRMWAYTSNLPPGVKHTGAFHEGAQTSRYWHPCILENGRYLPTKPDDYGPDLFTDFVIDFAGRNKDRPFFVYFTMPMVHGPHVETPDPDHPGSRWPKGFKSNVEYFDHVAGRLVRSVDDLGLKENTVFLFVGDNGTASSGKGTVTELGVRVPLIVRGPGVKSGVVSRELTDITDILPTLGEFAGAERPAGHVTDGVSLVPTLLGKPGRHREWIFSFLGRGRMLRDERWLLEREGDGRERLYDCGSSRDGTGYKDVSRSDDPEVRAARDRFHELLETLPGPDGHPGLKPPPPERAGDEASNGG
jgi:arylsulfatase A